MTRRWWQALMPALIVLVPLSCTSSVTAEPLVVDTGSVCTDRDSPTAVGSLCFVMEDGTTTLVGNGLQQGSTITVRGGKGDEVNFDVDSAGFSIGIGGQVLERPVQASGFWSDGEPLSLTIE